MGLKKLSFIFLCSTSMLAAAGITGAPKDYEVVGGALVSATVEAVPMGVEEKNTPLGYKVPSFPNRRITINPLSRTDRVESLKGKKYAFGNKDTTGSTINPLFRKDAVLPAHVEAQSKKILGFVQQQINSTRLSAPKEVLTFLITSGLAYGTTVGTFRDLVQAAYPPLGLSVHLEDYTDSSLEVKALIWGNLLMFHLIQIPTYYAVFEPYVRWLLKKCGKKLEEITLDDIQKAGTPCLRGSVKMFNGIRSLADGSIDLIRYMGNTLGLMRNMLTYPMFFAGMTLETYEESKVLETKVLSKFPHYRLRDTKEIRDHLLSFLALAYNSIYMSKDDACIEKMFSLYKEKDLEALFLELMDLAKEEFESLDPSATVSLGRKIGRYGAQALMATALVPLGMTIEYSMNKLIPAGVGLGVAAGALTLLRAPRAISAAGEVYDQLMGMFSGYTLERKRGIQISAKYLSHTPVRTMVGHGLYYIVLAVPMLMTFYMMSLVEGIDTPWLILGAIAIWALESVIKQPVVSHFSEFNHGLFEGERIISDVRNSEGFGAGCVYNLGVGTVNLLRGHTMPIKEDESRLAKASKGVANWLVAGERLTVSTEDSYMQRSFNRVANSIRHLGFSSPIAIPYPEAQDCGRKVANKLVDGVNWIFYTPPLTEVDHHKNQLLRFIRDLSRYVSMGGETVIHDLERLRTSVSSPGREA
ncbi:MAG: hypothetical protein H6492_00525 [Candidatus Paracaedibacteraceae bacterium]|nr:hypothetical protein [Candidatus Paracaedibacteraceae bacterium]